MSHGKKLYAERAQRVLDLSGQPILNPMTDRKELSIHTQKNWIFAFYITFVGLILLFISIDLFDYSEGHWFRNFVFAILFIFGVLALFSLPYLIFTKEKVITLSLTDKNLILTDSSNKEDADFNKSVPLGEIKKFYYKKKIKWGGYSEIVNGFFYLDTAKHEKLFLDLTLPEVKIKQESVEKILKFVKEGTRRT